jgi:hypothetical protein
VINIAPRKINGPIAICVHRASTQEAFSCQLIADSARETGPFHRMRYCFSHKPRAKGWRRAWALQQFAINSYGAMGVTTAGDVRFFLSTGDEVGNSRSQDDSR